MTKRRYGNAPYRFLFIEVQKCKNLILSSWARALPE